MKTLVRSIAITTLVANPIAIGCPSLRTFIVFDLPAQSVGISTVSAAPNASALLDISGNSKGMLIPRLTFAERTTNGVSLLDGTGKLPAAAQGLSVYQTDAGGDGEGFYYNTSATTTSA